MQERIPVTPEKQLLRLIEEHKEDSGKKLKAKAIGHFTLSLFSFAGWLGRLSFFKDRFRGLKGSHRFSHPDIVIVNNFLVFAIFMLISYFVFNFYFGLRNSKKLPSLSMSQQRATNIADMIGQAGLKRTVAYYLDKLAERDIFKMGPKTIFSAKGGPSERATEATKHLKLVGIAWSDNPDAMVEDTKALRTFFVKRGQMLGDIKVEAIFKDKVVLNYAGEDIELK